MILAILKQIAATDSTNAKQKILKSNADNEFLKQAFFWSYNKKMTFGVTLKTFPTVTSFTNEWTLENAYVTLARLNDRYVTGHAALAELADTLSKLNENDAEVIKRIINRDLECGIGATVANKVWDKLCPKTPQMLASPENRKLIEAILTRGDAYAELKADGARAYTDVCQDSVTPVSRSGNEYYRLERIKNAFRKLNKEFVIDGEFVYREPVGIMSQLEDGGSEDASRTKGNGIMNKSLQNTITQTEANNVVYQVWDIIPRDVYYGTAKSTMTQKERRKWLIEIVAEINEPCIEVIESTPVKTIEDAQRVYHYYLDKGLEGIILKCGHSVWENKRSKWWVKFKLKIEVDLELVGVYEHAKDSNKVGGFTFVSKCKRIKVNAGSGLSDTTHVKFDDVWTPIPLKNRDILDRELLMTKKDELIGTIWMLECNGLIKSKSRAVGEGEFSLFLPIIKLQRLDKSEANDLVDVFTL
ncbi:MAG: hypothetical protein ACRC3J_05235 [Culicoidibacterales bacterium]